MSVESVRAYLGPFGVADKIIEFDQSSATVELAARDLGCEPARIAKTMACAVGEGAVLVVCAGDAKLWSAAFKCEFGTKPRFVAPSDLPQVVGHPMGGVCPFAVKPGVRTATMCRSTSGTNGLPLACTLRIASRPSRSGAATPT